MYFEGYHPADKPLTYQGRDEFLKRVEAELQQGRPADPEVATKAVFTVLGRHVSPGEVDDARQMLPQEIQRLWPNTPSKEP